MIACLDVNAGRVVKGVQFVDLVDAGDPAEVAARHAAAGADEIVFLDITATHEARGTLIETVKRTAHPGRRCSRLRRRRRQDQHQLRRTGPSRADRRNRCEIRRSGGHRRH
jgi:hypothetical protein